MIKVLSLGAGIQSTTVFLMSCKGIIPRLDAAIFADTQWEPRSVYKHLNWLERQAIKYKIPIYRVSVGNLRNDFLAPRYDIHGQKINSWASIPLFLKSETGKNGILPRQCTRKYKVRPVEKFIREVLLGVDRYHRPLPKTVEHWFGISNDELVRIRDSSVRWKTHCYPLCNYPSRFLNHGFSRNDCIAWLSKNFPERSIPRSACIGCPFRNMDEWRNMYEKSPVEWKDAVEFDRAIRSQNGISRKAFLCQKRVPLEQMFDNEYERSEISNWHNECSGNCGV